MKSLVLALAVAGLVFAGLVVARPRAPVVPIVESGDPEFGLGEAFRGLTVTAVTGGAVDVDEYAGNAPVVVFVRDALCPVSRRYGPTTARITREFAALGVRAVYLNVSPLDGPEDMADDAARYGLEGLYAADHDFVVSNRLGVITTAEAFLFDAGRTLRYRGAIDDQYGIRFTKHEPRVHWLRDALAEVLAGDDVSAPSTPPEGCYLAREVHQHQEHGP